MWKNKHKSTLERKRSHGMCAKILDFLIEIFNKPISRKPISVEFHSIREKLLEFITNSYLFFFFRLKKTASDLMSR